MAVSYDTATKTARLNATVSQIDANASPATLEIGTGSFATVLVIITLADPSFTVSGGVMTLAGTPKSGVAAAGGLFSVARIKDGGGTVKVDNLTVGTSSADIILDSAGCASGQTITIISGTITHAA